jgi:hypothetical protein
VFLTRMQQLRKRSAGSRQQLVKVLLGTHNA